VRIFCLTLLSIYFKLNNLSYNYIAAVKPKVAVISVGQGNSYGHPHQETLDKLAGMGGVVYRTDLNGNIIITTDGINYSMTT